MCSTWCRTMRWNPRVCLSAQTPRPTWQKERARMGTVEIGRRARVKLSHCICKIKASAIFSISCIWFDFNHFSSKERKTTWSQKVIEISGSLELALGIPVHQVKTGRSITSRSHSIGACCFASIVFQPLEFLRAAGVWFTLVLLHVLFSSVYIGSSKGVGSTWIYPASSKLNRPSV